MVTDRYIEYGTSSHTIEANGADALNFTVNGTEVFAQSVEHPGTDPSPYMRPALRSAKRNAGSLVKGASSLEDALRKLAAHTEGQAKRNLTQNGNVDTGNLRASISYRRIQ